MTLVEGKVGDKFLLKDIDQKKLDTRLLSLGVCRGDACTIENIANGNVLIKTVETKIVMSEHLLPFYALCNIYLFSIYK